MSFAELVVVLIVGVLMIKPDDFPVLLDKLKNLQKFFHDIRSQVSFHLFPDLKAESAVVKEEELEKHEVMNYYLAKIIHIEGKYAGDYDAGSIKAYHDKLIAKEIASQRLQQVIEPGDTNKPGDSKE